MLRSRHLLLAGFEVITEANEAVWDGSSCCRVSTDSARGTGALVERLRIRCNTTVIWFAKGTTLRLRSSCFLPQNRRQASFRARSAEDV